MDKLIKQVLYYGTIAPSSHNTQPWSFKVINSTVEVYVDDKRTLKYSDPKKWQKMATSDMVSAIIVGDRTKIKEIAQLQYDATMKAFSDKKFREELSLWVRNNLTRAHDGMPGYVTNIPLLLSFLGSWMIKNINIGKMQGGVEKKWILSSPTILILTIKKNNPENLLKAGQVFEQIAIDVTANSLVYAPLGAIIETPEVSKKLKSLLSIDETPVMLIRIGYSNKRYKFAPKRKVEEVLIS